MNNMHSPPNLSHARRTSLSEGSYPRRDKIAFLSWRSAGTLQQTPTQPEHTALPPTPASAESQHKNSTLQRGMHNQHYHASSTMSLGRPKSLSSLDFELMVWKRAADKRAADKRAAKNTQLKRAALQRLTPDLRSWQLETKACANHAIKQCRSGPASTIESAAPLQWKIMAALTLFTASISCLSCTVWANNTWA